ncbi:hypothetical protein [Singulisphaera acidiphila]|nr:hypothetical protein [Singulisphaera acidiphila]
MPSDGLSERLLSRLGHALARARIAIAGQAFGDRARFAMVCGDVDHPE